MRDNDGISPKNRMRRSWFWFFLTVVGYLIGQVVGYLVSGWLGYDDSSYADLTTMHRWLIVLAVAPFMLIPPAMMFLVARQEREEGASSLPMIVAAILFLFLATITVASALGLSA